MDPYLTHRQQGLIVAGLGATALALALLVAAGSSGLSQPGPERTPRFIPSDQQLRSFGVRTVAMRSFHTEIVTDGYVAAGGGGRQSDRGLPVLPTQASDMLQAENDLAAAHVQYRNAVATEDRQHKLYLSEGAALKDWQQSQADLATAASAVASAGNRLRLLGKADNGQMGAFMVRDNSTVWLIANVREADAGLVHIGDPLTAHLAAYPNRTLTGQVAFVSSVIDPSTHRLVIGARVANPERLLKPNMLATLILQAGQASEAPAVPQNAVIYDGEEAHVWVVGPGRRLVTREVVPGRIGGGFVEITKGLKAGEHIATVGGLFIDQAMNGG